MAEKEIEVEVTLEPEIPALQRLRMMADNGELSEEVEEIVTQAEGDQTLLLVACMAALAALNSSGVEASAELIQQIQDDDLSLSIDQAPDGGLTFTMASPDEDSREGA